MTINLAVCIELLFRDTETKVIVTRHCDVLLNLEKCHYSDTIRSVCVVQDC